MLSIVWFQKYPYHHHTGNWKFFWGVGGVKDPENSEFCPFVCNFDVKLAFVAAEYVSDRVHNKSMLSISSTLISPSTEIVPHL